MSGWQHVCALEDILPDSGVAAWVQGHDVAVFRVRDAVYGLGNRDPFSGANVLARGIVGDLGGELVVASPLYKQHFSLVSGRCLEEPARAVPVFLCEVRDGQVWVRGAPGTHTHTRTSRPRLVVVGNGMAAMRTVEELLELAPARYDITVFGAEAQGYNRVLLSPLLSGEKQRPDVVTHPPAWFAERGVTLHAGDPVTAIDRRLKRVRSATRSADYDRLLLATGSSPLRLNVAGETLPGVMTFRDLSDVEAMIAACQRGGRAVVVGGGLLGIEAAHGLQARGMAVTLVHRHERLMERQLDAPAAALLQDELAARGIALRLGARCRAFQGDERVQAVQFEDDAVLPAQLVVVAIGVAPDTRLAQGAGLRCGRGVRVDDVLMTSDPAIYAVGECVQHRGRTFGLVAPLFEQARICAAQLAERGVRGYRSGPNAAQLKVSGVQVFSAGSLEPGAGRESLVLRDAGRGVYKRLVLEADRIAGAVLYGDVADSHWYLDLMASGADVSALRSELLFGPPAGGGVS